MAKKKRNKMTWQSNNTYQSKPIQKQAKSKHTKTKIAQNQSNSASDDCQQQLLSYESSKIIHNEGIGNALQIACGLNKQSQSQISNFIEEQTNKNNRNNDINAQKLIQNLMSNQHIVGRAKQCKLIAQFIDNDDNKAKILHIIGSPGIGKTSILSHIIKNKNLSASTVFTNAFSLSHKNKKQTDDSLIQIILQNKKHQQQHAQKQLIIVIDQFDCLDNRERVLAKIMQQSTLREIKVKLIVISNSVNDQKIVMDVQILELYFMPYTIEELCLIANQKLMEFRHIFKADVIQFAARLSLGRNGDFRELTKLLTKCYLKHISQQKQTQISLQDIISCHQQQNPIRKFILANTFQQNRILLKILHKTTDLKNYKKPKQYCPCDGGFISIENICLQHQKIGLQMTEIEQCIQLWSQMNILKLTESTCQYHYKQHKRITLQKVQKIRQIFNQGRYYRNVNHQLDGL